MISYIELINKVESFCNSHLQVKRFRAEFIDEMGTFAGENQLYPIVFMTKRPKVLGENVNYFTVDIYCWDLIQADRSNINICLSDTDLILTDIWNYFRNANDFELDIITTPSIEPLNNGLLDYCVGNVMTVEFEVSNYCRDIIPII